MHCSGPLVLAGNDFHCSKEVIEAGPVYGRFECIVCMQAWALLEQAAGNDFKARELFEMGSLVDPTHVHIWQAWGILEFKAGNIDRARALFQEVDSFAFLGCTLFIACMYQHQHICGV